MTCDSCLQTVPDDWPHSCYRACRTCRAAIEPGQDYCGEHKGEVTNG